MKTAQDILKLGNPQLYEKSELVAFEELSFIQNVVEELHQAMMDFRNKYGFGKAIAAPQIGVKKRVIYMHIDKPVVLINPEFVERSEGLFELWDNCMSFPTLMVRLKRHKSIVLKYKDLNWEDQSLAVSDGMAELLQHEYDHLEGVLATQRAIDDKSFKIVNPQDQIKSYSQII